MKSKMSETNVEDLVGKAAIFVRGLGEYLIERDNNGHTTAHLRKAQEAGMAYVTRQGDTISVPYISQLTSKIEKWGIFEKARMGKSYKMTWTEDSLQPMLDLLATSYGTEDTVREVTVADLRHRTQIIEHLNEHEGVVITSDAPVPKAAYKLLWDRFNKGDLVMGFFKPDTDQGVLEDFPAFEA